LIFNQELPGILGEGLPEMAGPIPDCTTDGDQRSPVEDGSDGGGGGDGRSVEAKWGWGMGIGWEVGKKVDIVAVSIRVRDAESSSDETAELAGSRT
jgi:hypothetical protein